MKTPEERFWERVDKDGSVHPDRPELGQCWAWTGSRRKHGHGHFNVPGVGTSAHQFSYHIHNGPIPEGLYVLHECDRGWCVNPAHLFVGTQKKNMEGAKERGRMPRGDSHSASTFTEPQVQEIRRLYVSGVRVVDIAKQFGRGRSAISHVIHDRWQHSQSIAPEKRNKGSAHACAKITEDDVRRIRQLRASGSKLKELADAFGLKIMAISCIVNRHTWKHVE